jgi:tight adherence protein C
MVLLAIIGLGLAGAALVCAVWAFVLPRTRAVARLESIEAYGFAARSASAAGVGGEPRKAPLSLAARALGDLFVARFGNARLEEMRRYLIQAGLYQTSPRVLLGYRVLATVLLPVLVIVSHSFQGTKAVAAVIIGAVLGWLGPVLLVRRRARYRMTEVDRALPDLIDQLVVTLEAGVGFGNSLRLAAERGSGPLGEELRLTLQEQRMGLGLTSALKHMMERADTTNMRSFVRAVIQGETLGVSIGTIMRNLAVEMRKRRRQAAEEQAQKAPVKMILPLVLFIFPSIGIVILGPAIIDIMNGLHT